MNPKNVTFIHLMDYELDDNENIKDLIKVAKSRADINLHMSGKLHLEFKTQNIYVIDDEDWNGDLEYEIEDIENLKKIFN
jgi:hypothetical protein